jgi:hypothetical protein
MRAFVWSLSSLLLSSGAIFTPASSIDFSLPTKTFRPLAFNQGRRDSSTALHVHTIRVRVVHLHAFIHRLGLGNFA